MLSPYFCDAIAALRFAGPHCTLRAAQQELQPVRFNRIACSKTRGQADPVTPPAKIVGSGEHRRFLSPTDCLSTDLAMTSSNGSKTDHRSPSSRSFSRLLTTARNKRRFRNRNCSQRPQPQHRPQHIFRTQLQQRPRIILLFATGLQAEILSAVSRITSVVFAFRFRNSSFACSKTGLLL